MLPIIITMPLFYTVQYIVFNIWACLHLINPINPITGCLVLKYFVSQLSCNTHPLTYSCTVPYFKHNVFFCNAK